MSGLSGLVIVARCRGCLVGSLSGCLLLFSVSVLGVGILSGVLSWLLMLSGVLLFGLWLADVVAVSGSVRGAACGDLVGVVGVGS